MAETPDLMQALKDSLPDRRTAPTPPAVPDDTTDPTWLDEAVEEMLRIIHVQHHVFCPHDPCTCYRADRVRVARGQLIAALPAITGGIADAVEALRLDPSESTTPHCIEEYVAGLENAATTIRNFGSEVGRA